MTRHVYDLKESASHERIAEQLRNLADQFGRGKLDLAYDDLHPPTKVGDPVELVLDLIQHKHDAELRIEMRWSTD